MNQNKVYRSFPVFSVVFALFFIGMGLVILANGAGVIVAVVTFLVAAIILLFASVSTVTVAADGSKVAIQNQSIIKKSLVEVNREDIQTVEIESSTHRSTNNHTRTTNFRVVLKKTDGTIVPVQTAFTGDLISNNKLCSDLRKMLNLNDPETPQGIIQNLAGSALEQVRKELETEQETITGDSDTIHETSGVKWQLVTRATGATPVSRWQSADYTLPGHFIYIAQKLHGSKDMGGGFLAGLAKTLYIQSMTVYGITDAHAPGMQNGIIFDQLEARIDPDFGGYGDSVAVFRQVLSIYAIQALENWARKRPLKQGGVQLAVLIGPKGVFVSTLGLVKPDFLQEMTDFGVELVKSLNTAV